MASWAQWLKLDNFIIYSQYFQQCKIIKIESLCWSCFIELWLLFNKNWWLLFKAKKKFPDGTSLRLGWIVPLIPGDKSCPDEVGSGYHVIAPREVGYKLWLQLTHSRVFVGCLDSQEHLDVELKRLTSSKLQQDIL